MPGASITDDSGFSRSHAGRIQEIKRIYEKKNGEISESLSGVETTSHDLIIIGNTGPCHLCMAYQATACRSGIP